VGGDIAEVGAHFPRVAAQFAEIDPGFPKIRGQGERVGLQSGRVRWQGVVHGIEGVKEGAHDASTGDVPFSLEKVTKKLWGKFFRPLLPLAGRGHLVGLRADVDGRIRREAADGGAEDAEAGAVGHWMIHRGRVRTEVPDDAAICHGNGP
jgi:hypothetical protein